QAPSPGIKATKATPAKRASKANPPHWQSPATETAPTPSKQQRKSSPRPHRALTRSEHDPCHSSQESTLMEPLNPPPSAQAYPRRLPTTSPQATPPLLLH